jgi:NADPH:quinone reductase-like Zn-dependent oxidoreductase
MRAAWYEKQGPARDVLVVGEMPDPVPGAGEVRIRIAASGVNPGDTEKREDAFGYGMAYSRVIPHSDGAGTVDHIVEVAFAANIEADIELLKADGSVATYATNEATPKVPVWLLVFKNIRLYFLGSDDFPQEAKSGPAF